MNAVFTILMACSPILGGVIHSYIGWRGNYGIVAFISCISWGLLFVFLPETHKQKTTYSWRQILYACKKCITNVEFMVSAIMPSLLYGCYLVFVSIAPFIYMQTMKLTMIMYVVNQAIIIAVFAIGSLLIGALIKKLGRKKIIIISSLLLAMSICLLLIAHTPIRLTIAMSLFSLSFSWIYPIVFSHSMTIFPGNKGLASSVIMSLRYFLCASLTGLVTLIF
jgi:MFS transporter, DHA1 family, multidrug resistance protein